MKIDLHGQRFGRLVVIGESFKFKKYIKWTCRCDCGNESTPYQFSLTSGGVKSCGCIAAEKSKERWKLPQEEARKAQSARSIRHGMSKHPAYVSWADMKQRCNNKSNAWYPSYGGRGICVSGNWMSFDLFWSDMGGSWFIGSQLGRVNNDGSYCKENCRWETATQQQNNKSNSRRVITPDGEMTASMAARKYGLTIGCIFHRANMGYSPEKLVQKSQREN